MSHARTGQIEFRELPALLMFLELDESVPRTPPKRMASEILEAIRCFSCCFRCADGRFSLGCARDYGQVEIRDPDPIVDPFPARRMVRACTSLTGETEPCG